MILAEYVIQEQATYLAAIQKGINIILKRWNYPFIIEDGILGEETKKAWNFLSLPFNFHQTEKYPEVLCYLESFTEVRLFPFIPQIKCKRNIKYLYQVICKKEWKKISNYFRNHVDVPLYVSSGLNGYNILDNNMSKQSHLRRYG
jgi:hypothetical protein